MGGFVLPDQALMAYTRPWVHVLVTLADDGGVGGGTIPAGVQDSTMISGGPAAESPRTHRSLLDHGPCQRTFPLAVRPSSRPYQLVSDAARLLSGRTSPTSAES